MHNVAWDASKENNVKFLHMEKKTSLNLVPFASLILFVIMLQPRALHNYIYKYVTCTFFKVKGLCLHISIISHTEY